MRVMTVYVADTGRVAIVANQIRSIFLRKIKGWTNVSYYELSL